LEENSDGVVTHFAFYVQVGTEGLNFDRYFVTRSLTKNASDSYDIFYMGKENLTIKDVQKDLAFRSVTEYNQNATNTPTFE
jgi:hypothetical protein